jgi:hypothetical protein
LQQLGVDEVGAARHLGQVFKRKGDFPAPLGPAMIQQVGISFPPSFVAIP